MSTAQRRAATLLALVLLAVVSACNDGALFSPNTSSHGAQLQLRPYYAVMDGQSSMSADINLVRLTITQRPGGEVVLQTEVPVNPADSVWNLPLDVPANSNLDILIELINKVGPTETTVYSGTINVQVTTGPQTSQPVPVYPGPPANLTVTSVTISPRDQNVLEGDEVQLSAQVAGPGSPTVTWISLNSAVATVDATGKVTTKAPGTAVIAAQAGPKQDNVVFVVGPRASKIDVTPGSVSLESLGADATFTGKILDVRNAQVAGLSLTWSVADPTIATQVTPGVFRARKNGTTTITASTTQAGRTVSANATLVVGQKATSVVVNPTSTSFTALGSTTTFTASAKDANGNDVTGVAFTWSSADASVATVDANGVVTAKGNGSTKIKAALAGGSAEATVTVQQQPKTMTVDPAFATLTYTGAQISLHALVKDANGNLMSSVPVFWISGAPGTVAVDPNTGTATAVTDGSTIVTAVAGSLRASAGIVVRRIATHIVFNKTTVTLNAGQTQQLTAQLVDDGGVVAPGNAITWSSSNPTIATVSSSGLVTGVKPGEATIKADAVTAEGTVPVVITTVPVIGGGGGPFTTGKVLIISNRGSENTYFIGKLSPLMPGITFASATNSTALTASYMSQFKVVLLYEDGIFFDAPAIGNAVAQYVNSGGNLILGTFFWQEKKDSPAYGTYNYGWGLLEPMDPFQPPNFEYRTATLDAARTVAHPLTEGLNSLTVSYYPNGMSAKPGTTVVAWYTDGAPLIGFTTRSLGQRIVAVAAFPPHEQFGGVSGDFYTLWTDAIKWAGGGSTPSLARPFTIFAPTAPRPANAGKQPKQVGGTAEFANKRKTPRVSEDQ